MRRQIKDVFDSNQNVAICCELEVGVCSGVASRPSARWALVATWESAARAYGVAVDLSFYLRFAAVFTLVQSCLTLINPSAPLSFRMP
jgi:hypothetical protein